MGRLTHLNLCVFQCENAEQKQKDLFVELSKIREEVNFATARWERLQQEKAELEYSFKHKLKQLQDQQESELVALEEELRTRHASDMAHLRAEHQSHVEELRTQQQEQIEELTAQHEAALEDLRTMHNITMATLQEEHARTMRGLPWFMKRLHGCALQDALAPYQHIEQDLKSLKEVLEMKNQQIHDQERKICQLEKVAQKNVYLEEKVQVLQQQNEDLKARIDRNLVMSRQLSEENANLQEYVERESSEKKRLSRDNEELLWRLQTSPHLSPCSSPTTPTHRGSPAARSSPARVPNANTLPR
uniref:Microtubule associated scaffold protein 2 n=1 Tax=Electrophorus electricus TaxID=8005 RepID=A0A4W4GK28_ELEEL